ncbi:MAG: hypothetical protein H5T33_07975 [Candidatus Methanosuratus sp.]|nr:hypothetical protein [Candidatus Methanosuratincola sp.]
MYPSPPTSTERSKLLLFSILTAASIAYVMEVFIGIGGGNRTEPLIWGFSILFSLLGHLIFPLLYLLGLLFGIYKVSGADGWWLDLGQAIAIAGLGYAIAEAMVFRERRKKSREDERTRKALHIASNLVTCLLIWAFGIRATSILVLSMTCIEILLIHLAASGIKVPGMKEWVENVGREGEIQGEGALYNALGILFTLGLLRDHPLAAIAVIIILAMGDGLATYIGGRYGRHKLPWNKSKSMEGMIGFAVGAFGAFLAIPTAGTAAIALLSSIIESLPLKVDDNIILPVAASSMYYLII